MTPRSQNRNRRIRHGISWNAANLAANKGVAILVRLALAWLLVPEHFGLVGMIVVVLGLIRIIADFGLQNALIQRPRDAHSPLRYDSAFWFLAGTGLAWISLLWVAGIPLMVRFYDEPRLVPLAMAMSASILLYSLSVVPLVRLSRRMRFRQVVIAELAGTAGGAAVAVALAWQGAGAWSLVAQQLLSAGLTVGLLWRACRWRPRCRFAWHTLRDVLRHSTYMLGSSIIYYLRTNMDCLFVGTLLGASALGVYTLAYTVTESLRAGLSQVFNRVMLPVYSQLQHAPAEIRTHYLATTRTMSLVLLPVSLSLVFYAEPLIHTLFNADWAAAITPTRILAAAGIMYAISGPSAEVLQGIGKPDVLFRIALANLVLVAIPSMAYLASQYGINGAAMAVLLAFTTMRFLNHLAIKRFIHVTDSELLRAMLPAMLGTSLATAWWLLFGARLGFVFGILANVTIFAALLMPWMHRNNRHA